MSETRPPKATKHCRHYSYARGRSFFDGGPCCARNVDLTAPGAWGMCMPEPNAPCAFREEYTASERDAWGEYIQHRMNMIPVAVAALGEPIACGTRRTVTCPHCGGSLVADRMRNGHVWLACDGIDCIRLHMNIRRETRWPPQEARTE